MLERGEVGQRLHRRAGLALALRDAIKLAERIRKTAGHRQDAAGLVFEHQRRALHRRAYTELCLSPNLAVALRGASALPAAAIRFALRPGVDASALDAFALDDTDVNHVIGPEAAPDRATPHRERQDAPVRQADAHGLVAFLAALRQHNRRRPV